MSFLGLDVGGSKCRYEWWPRGHAPGGESPTAQPSVDGVDAAAATLVAAVRAAESGGGRPDAVVCAVAGAGAPEVAARLSSAVEAQVDAPVAVVGDVTAAAAAGLREGPGLALWSGTGSFAVARDAAGALRRVGGRGFAFGDEGSGYDLVRRAIIGVLRAVDGRGRETSLSAALAASFGAPSPARLGAAAQQLSPREVAARLPLVLEAFEAGDMLAADVLTQGARQLVELGQVALRQAALEPRDGLRVALGGGALRSEALRGGLVRVLQAALAVRVDARPVGVEDAAVGAAWLAAGWRAGEPLQQRWVEDVAL